MYVLCDNVLLELVSIVTSVIFLINRSSNVRLFIVRFLIPCYSEFLCTCSHAKGINTMVIDEGEKNSFIILSRNVGIPGKETKKTIERPDASHLVKFIRRSVSTL